MNKSRHLWQAMTIISVCCAVSCEKIDNTPKESPEPELVRAEEIAVMLGGTRLAEEQVREVFDAVNASIDNGYDEEYTLQNIFRSPGSGVGDEMLSKSAADARTYTHPLREVFTEYFSKPTKGPGSVSAEEYLDYLKRCDLQLYWPFSDSWDGKTMPIITFAPENGAPTNIGWFMNDKGEIEQITVSESLAMERPVWIVNTNEDAAYTTLDIYRKNNPEWGQGGSIVIGPQPPKAAPRAASSVKTLILKDFTALRNYDSWWAGASEFWFKMGSVENFKASTEAELRLYSPNITDFIVVVRRKQVGQAVEMNTVLVSEWTSQLQNCALMIVEDDGGTITNWVCSAVVKYNSKSYGFEMNIPYRDRDDIVWRGQLSRKFIESNNDVAGHFGDVIATFKIE